MLVVVIFVDNRSGWMVPSVGGLESAALKLRVTEEENFVRACVLISRVTRNYYFKISYRPDFGDLLSA